MMAAALGVLALVVIAVVASSVSFWTSLLYHRARTLLPVEESRRAVLRFHCGMWLESPPRALSPGTIRRTYPFGRVAAYEDLLVCRCAQSRIALRWEEISELQPTARLGLVRGLRVRHTRDDLPQVVLWGRRSLELLRVAEQRRVRAHSV